MILSERRLGEEAFLRGNYIMYTSVFPKAWRWPRKTHFLIENWVCIEEHEK